MSNDNWTVEEIAAYTLTVDEVAAKLGVTPGRVRQLIQEGRIVGKRRVGAWFFKPDVVVNFRRKKRGPSKRE